jgi:hypothetical protein
MSDEPVPPSGAPGGGAGLPTNRKALFSVAFGVAAFAAALFFSLFLGFLLVVPSVTCGLHARLEIEASKGTEGGDLTAIVGLTIAATTLGLVIVSYLVSYY